MHFRVESAGPFTGTGGTVIQAIDFNPVPTLDSPEGVYAVIYPINTQAIYDANNPGPLKLIDSIVETVAADGEVTVTLSSSHRFSRRSPVNRIYVSEQPVSFCLSGGNLFRYENYGFTATQCTSACLPTSAPDKVLISKSLDNTDLQAFALQEATLRRNAIIAFDLNFTEQGDTVRLNHEVMMRNVP